MVMPHGSGRVFLSFFKAAMTHHNVSGQRTRLKLAVQYSRRMKCNAQISFGTSARAFDWPPELSKAQRGIRQVPRGWFQASPFGLATL